MPSTRRHVLALTGVAVAGSVVPTREAGEAATTGGVDWPMARRDPAGTGTHPTATGPRTDVDIAWQYRSSNAAGRAVPPILLDGTLYVTHTGLVALDSATGSVQFERGGRYRSTPASVESPIYTTETLAVTDSTGVVGLNAGGGLTVPGVNRSVGVQRWRGPDAAGSGFVGQPTAADPVTVNGTVYAAPPGTGAVVALDANDGSVSWRQSPRADETTNADINRPAVDGDTVFLTNWPYQVTAYGTEAGTQRWQRELAEQMLLAPVATDHGVVVQTRNGVSLLDSADGATIWDRSLDANATDGAPAVADGHVFLADSQGELHALDLATGESLWSTEFGGETTPVVADGVVYAVESRHTLVAIDAVSGERRFTFEPESYPISSPIVGAGRLYLSTRRGVLALEEAA